MIDYDGIGQAIATRIKSQVSGFQDVTYEADERDRNFPSMPLCDVTLESDEPELRAGQDYVLSIVYNVEILSFHMASYKAASELRSSLLKATQNALRAQPLLHVDLESIVLGAVTFSRATDENSGAWVASADLKVRCIAFVDRS